MKKVNLDNIPELPYSIEEALNRLRVNINFCGSEVKKIMVISAMPNEGKSFVAMQLWKQLSLADTKSILVDCDLRKSVLVSDYGIQGEDLTIGTSSYLADTMHLEEAIYETQFEYGDIVPNLENVINPSILLEGERFKGMLDELTLEYRYVIVDVPPLNIVSDGEKIGSLCDGAVLVVRSGKTSRDMMRNTVRQLQRAGCPLLGVILNRVGKTSGGYYYKKYSNKTYNIKKK